MDEVNRGRLCGLQTTEGQRGFQLNSTDSCSALGTASLKQRQLSYSFPLGNRCSICDVKEQSGKFYLEGLHPVLL